MGVFFAVDFFPYMWFDFILFSNYRDVEKQCKELVTRVDKRIFAGSATDQNVQDFNMKIDVILSSLEAMYTRIAGQDDITYLVSDAQDRLTELKVGNSFTSTVWKTFHLKHLLLYLEIYIFQTWKVE